MSEFFRKYGRRMLFAALLASPLVWVGIPFIYSANGVYNGGRVQAAKLGFYHHHIIKLRLFTCSTPFSSGVIVAYRKHKDDDEAQGRLCHEEIHKWVWYPSTSDLSQK